MDALQCLITLILLCTDGFQTSNSALDGAVQHTAFCLVRQTLILQYGSVLFVCLKQGIPLRDFLFQLRKARRVLLQFIRKLRILLCNILQCFFRFCIFERTGLMVPRHRLDLRSQGSERNVQFVQVSFLFFARIAKLRTAFIQLRSRLCELLLILLTLSDIALEARAFLEQFRALGAALLLRMLHRTKDIRLIFDTLLQHITFPTCFDEFLRQPLGRILLSHMVLVCLLEKLPFLLQRSIYFFMCMLLRAQLFL